MGDVDIGGLSILGTTDLFAYNTATPKVSYPTTTNDGPYTILGPVLLPQIYGKDLNAIEVGSSGIIALSIYDKNVLNINSNLNTTNATEDFNMITVEAQNDTDAIQLVSGATTKKVVLDSMMISEDGTQNVISSSMGSILMNNHVELANTLSVESDVTMKAKLSVATNVTLSSTLSVGGIATFSDDMFIEGKTLKIPVGSNVDRPTHNEDITVDGTAPSGSIYYNTEASQFQGLHSDGIWRQFGGVIDVNGDTKIEADSVTDTLFFFASNAETPHMSMDENVLSVSLHTVIEDTLSVGDATVLGSTLSVGDATVLHSTLSVHDLTYLNSNLFVNGTSTLAGELTTNNDVFMKQALSVEGIVDFTTTLNVGGVVNAKKSVNVEEVLSVAGEVFFSSNVEVIGNATFSSNVFIEDKLSVAGDTSLNSNLAVNNSLSVGGHSTMADYLSVGTFARIATTLSVGGATAFKSTLGVTGAANLGSSLSVAGATLLKSSLSVSGVTTLNNNLSVNGNVAIETGMSMKADLLRPTDGVDDLYVTLGDSEDGTLFVQGHLHVKGNVSSTNSVVNNVTVMDKKIILSSGADTAGSNDIIVDDKFETNHKSGIEVEGLPVGLAGGSNNPLYTEPNMGNVYEKSFLWNVSEAAMPNGSIDGMTYTGPLMQISDRTETTNLGSVSKEAFWELKGGQLRLSSVFKDVNGSLEKISYSMRITKSKELQFVKHEWKYEGETFVRQVPVQVATFGVNFGA